MRDVAIVGLGMIKFGRYPEKGVQELAAQACLLALKDADMSMKDLEIFISGNLYQAGAMLGQRILREIGQTGIPVINVANACATGSTAFREAYMSIASGAYDTAIAVGSEQMGKIAGAPFGPSDRGNGALDRVLSRLRGEPVRVDGGTSELTSVPLNIP